MAGVIFLAVFTLAALAIGALIVYGTRGEPNEWPAIGTNLDQAGDGMVWWRRRWLGLGSPSVPDAEEAMGPHYDIRTVDHQLEELTRHHQPHPRRAASWMEEPGALDRAGLVDEAGAGDAAADRPSHP